MKGKVVSSDPSAAVSVFEDARAYLAKHVSYCELNRVECTCEAPRLLRALLLARETREQQIAELLAFLNYADLDEAIEWCRAHQKAVDADV